MRALYCLSFGPKKEYVETDFKPVEYRLGTTLIAFLSTDFTSLRAKLLVRTTPMMENQAITEIKNVCACGAKATVNARFDANGKILTEGSQVFLGGNDSYIAMCHRCWRKKIRAQQKTE